MRYYFGNVTDIRKELYDADIMLAPIHIGGGTKYKILDQSLQENAGYYDYESA